MKRIFVFFCVLLTSVGYACPTGHAGLSPKDLKKYQAHLHSLKTKRQVAGQTFIPQLPTATSATPWGGSPSANWKPEAILANAVSRWLNTGWLTTDVADVWVSVPVHMQYSNRRVYNDGQTNASLDFGAGWTEKEPQMVAMLLKYKNGDRKVALWFSGKLALPAMQVVVTSSQPDKTGRFISVDEKLPIKNETQGRMAGWNVPPTLSFGDLTGNHLIWVRPQGWDSAFPIDFRMPIYTVKDLQKFAGSARTAGASALDPLGVSVTAAKDKVLTEAVLLNHVFGPEWLANLRNESIHGEMGANGENKTAVGGGLTWLVDVGANSTFKNLYTCFDPRDFAKESQFGVPSGGGWHEIGDAAETIINDMESSPILLGYATGLPWATPPNNLKFAWGLTDVATVRFLLPGEAQVTRAGDQTWQEDTEFRQCLGSGKRGQGGSGGRNYHWFIFPTDIPVCTQEWVHNCRPTDRDFGLSAGCAEQRKQCP